MFLFIIYRLYLEQNLILYPNHNFTENRCTIIVVNYLTNAITGQECMHMFLLNHFVFIH